MPIYIIAYDIKNTDKIDSNRATQSKALYKHAFAVCLPCKEEAQVRALHAIRDFNIYLKLNWYDLYKEAEYRCAIYEYDATLLIDTLTYGMLTSYALSKVTEQIIILQERIDLHGIAYEEAFGLRNESITLDAERTIALIDNYTKDNQKARDRLTSSMTSEMHQSIDSLTLGSVK